MATHHSYRLRVVRHGRGLRRIRTGGTRGHAPRVERKDSHGVADGACLEGVSVGRPKLRHPSGHGSTVSPRPCPSISRSRGNMASAAAPDGARRRSVPLFSSRWPCAYRSSSTDRLLDSLAVRCRSLLDEDGVLRELPGRRSCVIRDEPRPELDRIDAPPRVLCRPIHAGPRVAQTLFLKDAVARRPAKFGANSSQDWRRRGLVPGNAGAAKAHVCAAFVLARWSCSGRSLLLPMKWFCGAAQIYLNELPAAAARRRVVRGAATRAAVSRSAPASLCCKLGWQETAMGGAGFCNGS